VTGVVGIDAHGAFDLEPVYSVHEAP